MKTNKYISGILGVALAAAATSCVSDKEFLKEKPLSQLTTINAFVTSDQVLNTLLTGYYEYEDLMYPNWVGQGIAYDKSAGTDIIDAKYQNAHTGNFDTQWSTTASLPKSYWDKFYKVISYGNLALAHKDDMTWDDESAKARVAGEAYFLRGISYLRLAELFGGVPIVNEYNEAPKFDYVRAPRADVFQQAINDLKEAYAALPVKVESGRAGKGAAALYLSEAYLALGVENGDDKAAYAEAAKYAQEVITLHPIMTSRFGVRTATASGEKNGVANAFPQGNVCFDLFVTDNVISAANTESLWVMTGSPSYAMNAAYGGHRGCSLGLTPAIQDYNWSPEWKGKKREGATGEPASGPWKAYSAKYGKETSPTFQGGLGWAQYTPTWYASYTMWDEAHNGNSQDLRYVEDVTVMKEYLCCDENHALYEQKVGWDQIDRSTPELCGIFFPIFSKESIFSDWDYDANEPSFWLGGGHAYYYRAKYAARSAEAYLLLAEAQLRGGDAAKATETLNTLRARANAAPFSTVSIDTILDERARELLYEEFRWATLLRCKPAEWKQRIYDYGMYTARPNADPATLFPNARRWAEYTHEIPFNYLPIPQDYIDLNSGNPDGMKQNEGWK